MHGLNCSKDRPARIVMGSGDHSSHFFIEDNSVARGAAGDHLGAIYVFPIIGAGNRMILPACAAGKAMAHAISVKERLIIVELLGWGHRA